MTTKQGFGHFWMNLEDELMSPSKTLKTSQHEVGEDRLLFL